MVSMRSGEYIAFLQQEFQKRQDKNPRYSLRSYAMALEMDSSTLSAVMKGKRPLPQQKIWDVGRKIGLEGKDLDDFVKSAERGQRKLSKISVEKMKTRLLDLEEDLNTRLVIHWEYFAVFIIIGTMEGPALPEWIAERLGLELDAVEEILEDLIKMNLVHRQSDGRFTKEDVFLVSKANQNTYLTHMLGQRDNLNLALEKWEESRRETTTMSSITFIADPSNLQGARAIIDEFRGKLSTFMKQGQASEVYQLNIQLFPLTTLYKSDLQGPLQAALDAPVDPDQDKK
jgi:uncharacterized protein (TIGR02147 family)